MNELIREDNPILNKTITYSYDQGGNILNKKEYPYTIDTIDPLVTPTKTYNYAYNDTNWKDKLTGYDGKAITYDEIGNPLTYDGWNFSWEAGRQLTSMTNGTDSLSFKYDDAGIRTEKTVNGVTTKYYLNGDKVVQEDNGTDKIHYSYDAGGNLVSMNLNGTDYYYIRNAQGDIIGLLDGTGAQVVSYSYDSWGKLIATTGTLASTVGAKNPYLYRGYRYDRETGLYYLQSRYYNSDWGRFVNADGLVDLFFGNMYAYCGNNPVNYFDPTGYGAEAILGAIVSGVEVTGIAIGTAVAGFVSVVVIGILYDPAPVGSSDWDQNYTPTYADSGDGGVSTDSPTQDYLDSKARGVPTTDHTTVPHNPNKSNTLDRAGRPNSSSDLLSPDGTIKQRRYYGPDGKADLDIDYNHGGDEVFPHTHTWDYSKKPPRQKGIPWDPKFKVD